MVSAVILTFSQAVHAWDQVYSALVAAAAALAGLLFVAVSLRLNIFHQHEVADLRNFAALTFGNLFALILIGLLCLAPDLQPAVLGLPILLVGVLGLGWIGRGMALSWRVNPHDSALWRSLLYETLLALMYVGLAVAGLALWTGQTSALAWLFVVDIALLLSAGLNAWLLLSHAPER